MTTEAERLARLEMKLERLEEKVEEALENDSEMKSDLEVVKEWKAFWQAIMVGAKWVSAAMAATFFASITVGEKIAKYMGFIR
jgi:DNA/RNA-binding domain of Phe-tRNA-synthetase-like protein